MSHNKSFLLFIAALLLMGCSQATGPDAGAVPDGGAMPDGGTDPDGGTNPDGGSHLNLPGIPPPVAASWLTNTEELYAEVPAYDEGDPEWREAGDIEVYDARSPP